MTDHARNCRTILQMVGWLMIFRCGFYVFYLMMTSCSSPPGAEQSGKDAPLSVPIPLPASLLELAGLIGTWDERRPQNRPSHTGRNHEDGFFGPTPNPHVGFLPTGGLLLGCQHFGPDN